VDSESQIVGRVEIGQGTIIENSTLRGPVSIARDCHISNSFIGPFTSIGKGTVVKNSSIDHSVILEKCQIQAIDCLADSVIGRETNVIKGNHKFPAMRLFIGDDAKVEL